MEKKPKTLAKRDNWGSRIGYLMTAWFAAIGIGNMWRFPFRCAENGGGAFLLPYLVFILAMSLPAVIYESSAGKYGHTSTVDTLGKMAGMRGVGVMMLLLNMTAGYYIVVVSQSFYWVIQSASNAFATTAPETVWSNFMANKPLCFGMFVITLILSAIPPYFGIQKGIERVAKWIGGGALIIIVIGAIRGVTLPGAMDGIVYYLTPNWDTMFTAKTLTSALSQAYFTFGAGWGWFMILSSYLKRESDAGYCNINTGFADTSFALISGFAIIPTLFASGYNSETIKTLGSSTAYVAMPKVFANAQGGYIITLLFFISLFFAAYSCAYVIIEVIGSFFIDTLHFSRQKGTIISTLIVLVCGAPASMSESLLNNLDGLFGCYVLPTVVTLLVIAMGYRFGAERQRRCVINVFGNGYIGRWAPALFKYLVPVINVVLMVWNAYSYQSDPSSPWFMGFGGLGLVVVITIVVVVVFYWYDRKHNVPWVGIKSA